MKFDVGDEVTLNVDKDYETEKFLAGTPGTVQKVYPLSECYLVDLQGAQTSHRIMEIDLT